MTTPREHAIAALDVERLARVMEQHAWDIDCGGQCAPQLAREYAALGAEAETPEVRGGFTLDGYYGDASLREKHAAALAEAETPNPYYDHSDAPPWLRESPPHWVDLASPETAEALARAYWTKFAENTMLDGILSMPAWDDLPPESRKAAIADAAAILAAMRDGAS